MGAVPLGDGANVGSADHGQMEGSPQVDGSCDMPPQGG